MADLLCYYSIFLSTFKPKVNFLGPPYLPSCLDQSLSPNFEAPTMREHSPMFQTYIPVGKSETQTWAAINVKIRVAGKTGMATKIEWSALSHGIFHTNAVTFVILLQIWSYYLQLIRVSNQFVVLRIWIDRKNQNRIYSKM